MTGKALEGYHVHRDVAQLKRESVSGTEPQRIRYHVHRDVAQLKLRMNVSELVSTLMRRDRIPTIAEFERRADLSPNMAYRWLRGVNVPSRSAIRRMESAFGVEIRYDGHECFVTSAGDVENRERVQVAYGGAPVNIPGPTPITAKEWYMRRFSATAWDGLTDAQREHIERLFQAAQLEEQRIRLEADTAVKQVWIDFEMKMLRSSYLGIDPGDPTSAR